MPQSNPLGFELYQPLPTVGESLSTDLSSNVGELSKDLAIKHNVVDAAYKHYVDVQTSMAEKLAMIEDVGRRKEKSIEGYETVSVNMSDPDSGVTSTGSKVRFSEPDALDAFDQSSKSAFSMQLQRKQIADMYGVSEDAVTEPMWNNAKNYQYREFLKAFSKDSSPFEEFDRNQIYEPSDLRASPIEMSIKRTGRFDDYGREFVEAANPTTGKRVSFDMGVNPFLSARNSKGGFDFYTAMQTSSTGELPEQPGRPYKAKSKDFKFNSKVFETLKSLNDSDGRLSEDLDIIQSAAYGMFGRAIDAIGKVTPEGLLDQEKWAKVVSPELGQALQDAWAGVKPETRDAMQKRLAEARAKLDKGEYISAATDIFTQLDRMFAESLPFIGTIVGGTLAIGGVGSALGITSALGRAGLAIAAATPAALDKALQNAKDYEKNNNGKKMDSTQWAMNIGQAVATLIPEVFLIGSGLGKLLGNSIMKGATKVYESKALWSGARGLATGTLGEAAQEAAEGIGDRYVSQNQDKAKSLADITFDNDTLFDAMAGGIMGGVLSGIGISVSVPMNMKLQSKVAQQAQAFTQRVTTRTDTGQQADEDASNTAMSTLSSLDLRSVTTDNTNIRTTLSKIDNILNSDIINEKAKNQALATKNELLTTLVSEGNPIADSILREHGKSKEDLLDEFAFYSNPNMDFELRSSGKRLTKESSKAIMKEYEARVEAKAKELGLTSEQAKKSIAEVHNDVRFGPEGYQTYQDRITAIDTALNDPNRALDASRLEKERARIVEHIKKLYTNQNEKAASIASTASTLANDTGRTSLNAPFKSPVSDGFLIHVSDLFGMNEDSGVHRLMNSVERDLSAMYNMLGKLGVQVGKNPTPIIRQRFNNAVNRTVTRLFNEKGIKGAVDTTDPSTTIPAMVKRLLSSKNNRTSMSLQGIIGSNFTEEQITKVRDTFDSTSDEYKALTRILNIKSFNKTETEDQDKHRASRLFNARESRVQLNETTIEKANTVLDINKLQSRIAKIRHELNVAKRDNNDQEVIDLLTYYGKLYDTAEYKKRSILNSRNDNTSDSGNRDTNEKSTSTSGRPNTHENDEVGLEQTISLRESEEIPISEELDPEEINRLYDEVSDVNFDEEEKVDFDELGRQWEEAFSNAEAREQAETTGKTTRKIADVDVSYEVVSRDSISSKGIAGLTDKGGIRIADDLTLQDIIPSPSYLERLSKLGVDLKKLVSKFTPQQIQDFILLHEHRHEQQIAARDSFDAFMAEYDEHPGRFEYDALLYPLYQMKLIDLATFKKGIQEIRNADSQITEQVFENPVSDLQGEVTQQSKQTTNVYAGTNENAQLSNFAIRPFTANIPLFDFLANNMKTFQSVEQAFQFAKSVMLYQGIKSGGGNTLQQDIRSTTDGDKLRKLGRSIRAVDPKYLQEWDTSSSQIMSDLIRQSFEQNPKAQEALLATGDTTITHIQDKGKWGKEFPRILMEVREGLRKSKQNLYVDEEGKPIPDIEVRSIKAFLRWLNNRRTFERYVADKNVKAARALQPEYDASIEALPDWTEDDFHEIFQVSSLDELFKVYAKFNDNQAIHYLIEDQVFDSDMPQAKSSPLAIIDQVSLFDIPKPNRGQQARTIRDIFDSVVYSGKFSVREIEETAKDLGIPFTNTDRYAYGQYLMEENSQEMLAKNWIEAVESGRIKKDEDGEWSISGLMPSAGGRGGHKFAMESYYKTRYDYGKRLVDKFQKFSPDKKPITAERPSFVPLVQESTQVDLSTPQGILQQRLEKAKNSLKISSKVLKGITDYLLRISVIEANEYMATMTDKLRESIRKQATNPVISKVIDNVELTIEALEEDRQKHINSALVNGDEGLIRQYELQLAELEKVSGQYQKSLRKLVSDTDWNKTEGLAETLEQYNELLAKYDELITQGNAEEATKLYGTEIKSLENFIGAVVMTGNNYYSYNLMTSLASMNWNNTSENRFLYREFFANNTSGSLLADAPVNRNNPLVKDILNVFKKISATLPLDEMHKEWQDSSISAWNQAYYLRLLYPFLNKDISALDFREMVINGKGIDANVAVAMDMALREWFATMDVNKTFNPRTNEDVQKKFGFGNRQLEQNQLDELRGIVRTHGIPRTSVVSSIGDCILDNLGIKPNSDTKTKYFPPNMSAALGNYALVYAQSRGWIRGSNYEITSDSTLLMNDEEGNALNQDKQLPCIKFISNKGETLSYILSEYETKEEYIENGVTQTRVNQKLSALKKVKFLDSKPSTVPYRFDENQPIRNGEGLTNIPNYAKGVLKKLYNTAYRSNTRLIEVVLNDKYNKRIMERLGLQADRDIEQLPLDIQDSAYGVNQSVTRQMDTLREIHQSSESIWFFRWFFSGNGRIFMDSNHLNMQGSKSLHRFLVVPEKLKRTFKKNNKKQLRNFYFTICQAFDSTTFETKPRGSKDRTISEIAKNILKLTEHDKGQSMMDEFIMMDEEEFCKKYEVEGIENFGQCLSVIQAIQDFHNADREFETYVSMENDSTTSGYVIRLLQFPMKTMKKLMPKMGIIRQGSGKYKTIHNYKKDDGFLDIYRTIASISQVPEPGNVQFEPSDSKSIDRLGIDNINSLYSELYDILPKKNLDGSVSSKLRKLFKDPTVTFGYTRGKSTLTRSLGENITEQLITDYVALGNRIKAVGKKNFDYKTLTSKERQLINVFSNISKKYGEGIDLHQALRTKYSNQIYLTVNDNKTSLQSLLSTILQLTYGNAVWEALEKTFKPYVTINETMNVMFNSMFDMFNIALTDEITKLKQIHGENIPAKAEKKAIEGLLDMFPAIELMYSESIKEGALVIGSEREVNLNTVNRAYFRNKQDRTTSINSYASVKKFINGGQAGAVLPIHFIDGQALAVHLSKWGDQVLPIHDAIQVSGVDAEEITSDFNKFLYLVNKRYNMYDTLVTRTESVYKAFKERYPDIEPNINMGKGGNSNPNLRYEQLFTKNTPLSEALKYFRQLADTNNADREAYYREKGFIGNIDGPGYRESGWTIDVNDTIDNYLFKEALAESDEEYRSNPHSYTTNEEVKTLLENGLEDSSVRLEIFDRLAAMDRVGENLDHFTYLKSLISKVNPNNLKDIAVTYRELKGAQGGTFTRVADKTSINIQLDRSIRLSPYSTQSSAEVYAHEIVHAGTRVGIMEAEALGLTKELRQLINIQKRAMDVIEEEMKSQGKEGWYIFMPEGFNVDQQGMYESNAKTIWKYVFGNENIKSRESIHEFLTYGMTNQTVMDVLRRYKMVTPQGNLTLLNRLINLGVVFLNVLRGEGQLRDILGTAYDVLKGNRTRVQKENLLAQLIDLYEAIDFANENAGRVLNSNIGKFIENIFKFTCQLIIKGNEKVSPLLKMAINIADVKGLNINTVLPLNNLIPFQGARTLAKLTTFLLVSRKAREALGSWLSDMLGLSQQSMIQTILREVQTPDYATSELEVMSAITRRVEGLSKSLEETVKYNLREAFGLRFKKDRMSQIETKSLTQAVLMTDLNVLLKDTSIDDIVSILGDESRLEDLLQVTQKELSGIPNTRYNWYVNQAQNLGYYMATGIGLEALALNADNIAEGRFTGQEKWKYTSKTRHTIDKLATLYALKYTDVDTRKVASTLNKKGLENYLITHDQFVKETYNDGSVNKMHIVKGYTKQLFDNNVDVQITSADVKTRQEMKNQGYKLVEYINQNDITGESDLAVYKRRWKIAQHRDSSSFILVGQNAMGTSLQQSAENMVRNIPEEFRESDKRKLIEVFTKRTDTIQRKQVQMMLNGVRDVDLIHKTSKGYTPIVSPTGIADYRITMSNKNRIEYMNQDLDGISVLGKMYASKNTKMSAKKLNKEIITFLKKDMKNMSPIDMKDSSGRTYIKLTSETTNKFLKDSIRAFPIELRQEIKKAEVNGEGFFVRDDWLQQLFGIPSTSIVDNEVVDKYTNAWVKVAIQFAELVVKHIGYFAKQNVIIRTPRVVIGNILSNIAFSAANGQSPTTVWRKTFQNAQNVKDYVDNQTILNRLEFKNRIGTITPYEKGRINWYKQALEVNPLRPLMLKGMYQAIIEDINPEELDSMGKISRFIKGVEDKLPKSFTWTTRQVFMTEGTPFYDFMFQLTQYSDFVARATEYQIQMEKVTKKHLSDGKSNPRYLKKGTPRYEEYETKVVHYVWNAFINYDKPQSTKEQYLNDMGLVMFTKYAKRIQPVILRGLVENPISSLLFLFSQIAIIDTDDIFEQNVFNKSWSALVHNPIDNFFNAIVPIPVQWARG